MKTYVVEHDLVCNEKIEADYFKIEPNGGVSFWIKNLQSLMNPDECICYISKACRVRISKK